MWHLVEGDHLGVLIGQVKRMGCRVTVLKTEKARKGGLAGVSPREHCEVLIEAEGVGEPPEQFFNAITTVITASAHPRHRILPEQAQDAGFFHRRRVVKSIRSDGDDSDRLEVGGTVVLGIDPDASDSGSGTDQKDEDLQSLLNEARSQLDSGTEVAATDLEAQLIAIGIGQTSSVTPHKSAPNPVTNSNGLRSGATMMDVRL